MKTAFNKKKINLLFVIKIIKYFIIFFLIIFLSYIIYDDLKNKKRYKNIVQEFSENFNYQFKIYEVNTLYRIDKNEISKIINKYLDESIFLIPLNNISNSIHNLKWVKAVNLSTNLKNKIKIEIVEYQPIGLYAFNNQFFYFSKEGKIIDKYKEKNNEKFIIFHGNESIKESNRLLKTLDKVKNFEQFTINEAYYINGRRWNIKLANEIMVYLSEKNIETSLRNYIKLVEKLNESEIEIIQSIDLRNNEKAIISIK